MEGHGGATRLRPRIITFNSQLVRSLGLLLQVRLDLTRLHRARLLPLSRRLDVLTIRVPTNHRNVFIPRIPARRLVLPRGEAVRAWCLAGFLMDVARHRTCSVRDIAATRVHPHSLARIRLSRLGHPERLSLCCPAGWLRQRTGYGRLVATTIGGVSAVAGLLPQSRSARVKQQAVGDRRDGRESAGGVKHAAVLDDRRSG